MNVYIHAVYRGRKYPVLLDTGCEVSVLSTKILPDLDYNRYDQKLYAANMSSVPILGKAAIVFNIEGSDIEEEFLVSDAIDELIFGADWLNQNRCLWDFANATLLI